MALSYRQFMKTELKRVKSLHPSKKQSLIMKMAAANWQAYKKKHGLVTKAGAKRKSPRKSPKKKSPRRKTPKRRTPKRKTPKRKTPKRKTPKRKTPKRKTPKRKTPKRKTPKRKTPKRRQYGYGYQGTDMAALKSILLQRLYGSN